jgi:hypothetical protein
VKERVFTKSPVSLKGRWTSYLEEWLGILPGICRITVLELDQIKIMKVEWDVFYYFTRGNGYKKPIERMKTYQYLSFPQNCKVKVRL